jgi:hypothetical protein
MKTEYLLIGAGAAVVLFLATAGKKAAAAVGQAIDPTSDKNIAYKATNAVGGAVTGDPGFSLGVKLYELTHGKELERSKAVGTNADPALKQTGKAAPKGAKIPNTNKPGKPGTTGGIKILEPMQGPTTGDGWLIPAKVVEAVDPFYF